VTFDKEPHLFFAPRFMDDTAVLIAVLRAALPSAALADADLLRFLQASSMELDDAYARVRMHIDWVERVRPGSITQTSAVRAVLRDGVVRLIDGGRRPVLWVQAACWHPAAYDVDTFVTAVVYVVEKALALGDSFVAVFDLSGWSHAYMWHIGKLRTLIDTLHAHYPLRLDLALIVRAPLVFDVAWRILKHVIDPITVRKVTFVVDQTLVPELLAHVIATNALPLELGGARITPIPVPNIPGEPDAASDGV
jgi:hypothetical protein